MLRLELMFKKIHTSWVECEVLELQ